MSAYFAAAIDTVVVIVALNGAFMARLLWLDRARGRQ